VRLLRSGILLLGATLGLLGCNDLEVCGATPVPMTNANGESYRCTVAEDCPRSSRASVCVTDGSPEQECIRCEDTRCVRVTPEAC
jgi:hypothetical protein